MLTKTPPPTELQIPVTVTTLPKIVVLATGSVLYKNDTGKHIVRV